MGEPDIRRCVLPPIRYYRAEASLVSKHLLENHTALRAQAPRRPGNFGYYVCARTHGQLCDECHTGNSNVSIFAGPMTGALSERFLVVVQHKSVNK